MDSATTNRIRDGMAYEASRKAPPEGFPELPEIAAGRYTDPAFLALEKERLWKRSWLYAGHIDQLAEPGSWFLTRATGAPIIVLKDLKGELRAFYNTCRHRGGPLVKADQGNDRGFVCGYHGWTYTLDGQLVAVRDKRDFVGLDFACQSLIPVACQSFGG